MRLNSRFGCQQSDDDCTRLTILLRVYVVADFEEFTDRRNNVAVLIRQ